jgi:hypothetical protein
MFPLSEWIFYQGVEDFLECGVCWRGSAKIRVRIAQYVSRLRTKGFSRKTSRKESTNGCSLKSYTQPERSMRSFILVLFANISIRRSEIALKKLHWLVYKKTSRSVHKLMPIRCD